MNSQPSRALSREEVAAIEVGHTTISARLASLTTLAFMAIILTVPVLQHVIDVRGFLSGERSSPVPQSLEILSVATEMLETKANAGLLQPLLKRNAYLLEQINRYEERLENQSILTKKLLGPVQEFMTGHLGAGNEKVYPGNDAWLYYRPDVDYLTGPAFLNEGVLRRRSLAGNAGSAAIQPNPVKAIINLKQQLAVHGIELVIVPAPVKPAIVAKPLGGPRANGFPLHNASFNSFKQRVEDAGVLVFDPSEILSRHYMESQCAPYLETDTHWTPDGMDSVAEGLALFLKNHGLISASGTTQFERESATISATGDIEAMLQLPDDSALFEQETVTIQQVRPIESTDTASEILFLGDSFANIYSAQSMGWGEGAGLVEQLEFYLQQPVDYLVRNDNGSHATREMLRDAWARGTNPLVGKKVVIWEFAARELAFGDWRIFDVKPDTVRQIGTVEMLIPENGQEQIIDATVLAVSGIPVPGSVPYRDHVCMVHFSVADKLESVAFMHSMKNNELTDVADWNAGDTVKIKLSSWGAVSDQFGSINQSNLDEFLLLEAYGWAEPVGSLSSGKTIPVRLFGYVTGLILLLLIACRSATDRIIRSGIALIGISWLVMAVFLLRIPTSIAEADVVSPNSEASPNLSEDNLSFQAWCSNAVSEATLENQLVVRGVDDWLFLRDELRHLSVGPFWGEKAKALSKASKPEYADPLPAILDFHTQLKESGVELWIVPVPPKATIYPDKISRDTRFAEKQTDADLRAFYKILQEKGITVIDMADAFRGVKKASGHEAYCRQDSHWATPAIELVANELSARIQTRAWYASLEKEPYLKKTFEIEINGDLRQMLQTDLPAKEKLSLNLIENKSTGQPPVTDEKSPVLILGDSHTLVFHSGGDMHAVGAGLVDQLTHETGIAYDLIGVKGSGAGPSRRSLYGKSRKDPEYLAEKKLIIWCFSAREFTESTGIAWRKMPVK